MVMKDHKPVKIRLYGVDCPEKRQAFGSRAKQFTADNVFRKIVEIKPVDRDRYGRTVAWVIVDGQNLNQSLVEAGLAWHYKKYSSDRNLAELEDQARKVRVGLWFDPHAVPPWTFRKKGTN
jgi:endonuclease YncB( thermonuclease family)